MSRCEKCWGSDFPCDECSGKAALPPVRSEPLLAAYDRFKHLDRVFEMVGDPDGTENTDPFHAAARDLWRAIKSSLGHTANTTNLPRSEVE